MALPDIQFNDANLNGYEDIPSSLYPVLAGVSIFNIVVSQSNVPTNGVLADGNNVSIQWNYPVADELFVQAAVGYQLQVFVGNFNVAESQPIIPPGPIVLEQISNFNDAADPAARYINLVNGGISSINVSPGILKPGNAYTVRIRALVFSEFGAGTLNGQYFKYTEWATANFRVNNVPAATNLRVNGVSNPSRLPGQAPIVFSFTFSDFDGPSYFYRIQLGTTPGGGFSPNIWDSGLIAGGSSFGIRDFDLSYSGPPLAAGVIYAWRVDVQDGLVDGGFTSANDTFSIDALPTVQSLRVNGAEILFGANPVVGANGGVLAWTFSDQQGDSQRAYNLSIVQLETFPGNSQPQPFELLETGDVFSPLTIVALPNLPIGATIQITLKVRNAVEFGLPVTATFITNAPPQVLNLFIDNETNPGNVNNTSPVFSWTFFDEQAGDSQQSFRIQVATNNSFSTLIWDSGNINSIFTSVVYGSTPSPIIPAVPLAHGSYYFVRVQASDGVSFSDFTEGFFSVNTAPGSPLLTSPSAGAFSGTIDVTWIPASPLDADGDPVSYSIEITSLRSSNQGWEYLDGPFSSLITTYKLDLSKIKSGNDYGVRVIANDGFTDSDPTISTSPVNPNGLGFTVLNHPPATPIFTAPLTGSIVSSILKIEWLEADPVDVDGDSAFYIIEMTRDVSVASPVYESLGIFNEGTSNTVLDVSTLPDGSNYKLRITAQDDKGGVGITNYSTTFAIINTPTATDFEMLGTTLYVGTSDGRILRARESIWQVEEDFDSNAVFDIFDQFSSGSPTVGTQDGTLLIQSPPGSTFIFKIGPPSA